MQRHGLRLAIMMVALGVLKLPLNGQEARSQSGPAVSGVSPSAMQGKIAEPSKVAPDSPVITIEGFCDPASAIGKIEKPCRTIVTRSEFEKLAELSAANTLAGENQLAVVYAKFSLFAREAHRRGMDNDPNFLKKLELSRIQLLGQMLIQDLQAKSEQITEEEIRNFYRDHPGQFEQATVQRIFVPETKFRTQANRVQDPIPESAPEMKELADKISARARAGEDFAKLQKEVFQDAGFEEDPSVDLGPISRSNLRAAHQSVFDLDLGQVSPLIHAPEEGYYIYKLRAKQSPSLESIKSEVRAALQKQRMDGWINSITNSAPTKLSEEYFGLGANKSFQAR